MRGMHLVKNNEDYKLDQLNTCHDNIEKAVDNLHSLLEKINMSELEYAKMQLLFDKVYLELYQLEKELRYF